MKIRFYLHTNKTTIYADCRWGREPYAPADKEAKLRISTTVQLTKPESLVISKNNDGEKFTEISRKEKDFIKKRLKLSEFEKVAGDIVKEFELQRKTLYPAELGERIQAGIGKVQKIKPTPPKDLDYYWERVKEKHEWAETTLDNYEDAHREFTTFTGSISPQAITPTLVQQFYNFRNKVEKVSNITLIKVAKYLRHVLKEAALPYEWVKKAGRPSEEDLYEPHTWEEVMKLWQLDVTTAFPAKEYKTKRRKNLLGAARDRYVFVCLTGPRFSDTRLIDPINIGEEEVNGTKIKVLRYHQGKNKAWATIALHPIALEIIERYQGQQEGLFPKISKSQYNKHIKTLGKMAELTRPIKKIKYLGVERVETILPLHKAMSSHFARATWATMMLEAGMDIAELKKAGGWQSLAMVLRYGRIRQTRLHQATLNAWEKLKNSVKSENVPADREEINQ